MMRAAADAFIPGSGKARADARREAEPAKEASSREIDVLREQMAAMQKKLDELSK